MKWVLLVLVGGASLWFLTAATTPRAGVQMTCDSVGDGTNLYRCESEEAVCFKHLGTYPALSCWKK